MPQRAPIHRPRQLVAPMHNPRGREATERQQRRAMHTGSKGWKLQRARVLARDAYTCQRCGFFGEEVDHIHDNAAEIVDDDQLQTLCASCHSSKTMGALNASRNQRKAHR